MTETSGRVESGGPARTPRSEIMRTRTEGKKYEPAIAIDFSPSMYWSSLDESNRSQEYPSPVSRRAILEAFLPLYIAHLEKYDSEAEHEQADGSDEMGGVYAAGFSGYAFEIGDLNSSNASRKLAKAWEDAKQHDGTVVGPAIEMLKEDFKEEFAGEMEAGTTDRVHEVTLVTDGEPADPEAIVSWLHDASEREVYLICIIGHGSKAVATANLYKKAAAENEQRTGRKNVHVALFDAVSNPVEIAQDMVLMAS